MYPSHLSLFLVMALFVYTGDCSHQVICVGQSSDVPIDLSCTSLLINLTAAFQQVNNNGIIWVIKSHEVLQSVARLEHLFNVTIAGYGGTEVIQCNQVDIAFGLQFVNVSNLTFCNLTVKNCGALYNVTKQEKVDYYFSTAIYLENSTNVEISHTNVTDSIGTGLFIINCNGNTNIHHSYFTNNTINNVYWNSTTLPFYYTNNILLLGGGGIYFELTKCSPSWQDCDDSINTFNSHSHIHIHNCVFVNNSVIADPDNIQFTVFRGGGLIFWLTGNAYNNTAVIEDNEFMFNRGLYGGGLFIQCKGTPNNNSITVRNITSMFNEAVLGGGGMDLGFFSSRPHNNRFNSIRVILCTLVNNKAYFGGGNAFFSTLASETNPNNIVEFHNTTWTLNKATYGSAIYLEPVINDIPANAFFPIPRFVDCNFTRNFITFNISGNSSGVSTSSVGAGAFNSKAISIRAEGYMLFDSNNGTAIYFIDSNFIVLENTSIILLNNNGTYGGGISINGFASMYISANTNFRFINNTATVRGGAIYFQSTDIKTSLLTGSSCFIERERSRSKFTTNFYFLSNTDQFNKTMYISSLLPCNKLCQSTNVYLQYFPPEELLSDECIGNFTFDGHNKTVEYNVATDTSEFDYNIDGSTTDVFYVVPGKDFVIPFETRDELGHISPEPLFAILRNDTRSINLKNIYTANKRFKITGQADETGHLDIGTLNFRNLTVGIDIKLSHCPPGFINEDSTCICSADTSNHYEGITRCDNQKFEASIITGYWVGYSDTETTEPTEDNLYTGPCPPGYCNDSTNIRLPSDPNKTLLNSLICGAQNRNGTLCGECIEGHSVYFNSPNYKCGSNHLCSYGPLFYILSNIIPISLVFTLIILFGVNFSAGTWNGFVFYAQIVSYFAIAGTTVDHNSIFDKLQVTSVLIYGPFSLKFFTDDHLSYCFVKGANFFAIMGIEFLTLFYAFVLVIILVFVMRSNYFFKFQTLCCKRPIFKSTTMTKALTTFLILCYSQTTQICFEILHIGLLTKKGGDVVYPARVFQMGTQPYFTGAHIPLAIVALIGILTVVSITPLCLILYPIFYKVLPLSLQELSVIKYLLAKVELMKPVFDAFQSCYQDKYRFFAGLYFLYRGIFVAIFALVSSQLASLSIAQVILMILLALHLWIQPYKVPRHNYLDGSLFLLLGIINTLTIARYFESTAHLQTSTVRFTGYLQFFLIYIPIIVIVVTLIGLAVKKCYKIRKVSKEPVNKALARPLNDSSVEKTKSPTINFLNMDVINGLVSLDDKALNNDDTYREESDILDL